MKPRLVKPAYAENVVYRNEGLNSTYWKWFDKYKSDEYWTAESVPSVVQNTSDLAMLFYNRGPLTSARAGNGYYIEYINPVWTSRPDQMMVVGNHFYYDSLVSQQRFIGTMSATDCNLSQWGFGDR